MECSTQSSTSNDEYVSSEGAGTTHLNSKSDQVMLRKHLHVRRQRAANACTQCHLRKVRCDVSRFGLPCTNCRADSKVCTIKESRRGVRNRKVESSKETVRSGEDSYVKNASNESYPWSNSRPTSSCGLNERSAQHLEYQHLVPWQLPSAPNAEHLRDACTALILLAKQLLEKTQEFAASKRRENSISTPVGASASFCEDDQESSPNSSGSGLSQGSLTPADCTTMWCDGGDVLSLDSERWSGCDGHPKDDADVQYAFDSTGGGAGQLHDNGGWPALQADEWPCFPG